MVLAPLAYLGTRRTWARVLALVFMTVLLLSAGGGIILVTGIILLSRESQPPAAAAASYILSPAIELALLTTGVVLAVFVAALGFIPRIRQRLACLLPIDPTCFVHTLALVAVVALTLMSFVPLIILNWPPLLLLIATMAAEGEDLLDGRGTAGLLRDELYWLVWLAPGTVLAVGYGVCRDLKQALARLGLTRPTKQQVIGALGLSIIMVLTLPLVSLGIDSLWQLMDWPRTDMEAFEQLAAHFFSPLGALVIGVVAGLGEELAVRGVLQPRLGIWLSNLFFTALHALQYHWDVLVVVFLIGLLLGWLRDRTNTSTTAIVHGTYDFLLIMGMVLGVPWLSE
jgi:membrane protease YdiL (CAAX protease family)